MEPKEISAAIIGGGIGGLITTLSFLRAGSDLTAGQNGCRHRAGGLDKNFISLEDIA